MTVDRCSSCGHPLAEGEWTVCDAECRHGGKVRLRDAYNVQRGWHEHDLDTIGMSAGAAQEDTVDISGVQGHRYDCEAHGRARAEERDCPECGGLGWFAGHEDACFWGTGDCQCDGIQIACRCVSGRVSPLLCQACEGGER